MVHAGPFANISIGASSVIADLMALKLVGSEKNPLNDKNIHEPGYVVTEAGFDFAMGGERFFDIKCRSSGLVPDAVVLVATVRALKSHGGAPNVKPGQSLPKEYTEENIDFVAKGVSNLVKQIENIKTFGIPVVVAINRFETDSQAEIEVIKKAALNAGASHAVTSNHWMEGGKGAVELAHAVVDATKEPKNFNFLYDVNSSIEDKLTSIVQKCMVGQKSKYHQKPKKIDTYKNKASVIFPSVLLRHNIHYPMIHH